VISGTCCIHCLALGLYVSEMKLSLIVPYSSHKEVRFTAAHIE